MSELVETRAIGRGLERLDGPEKVTGTARYAYEHPLAEPLYLFPVQATIARGRVEAIDTAAAGSVRVMSVTQPAPRTATTRSAIRS